MSRSEIVRTCPCKRCFIVLKANLQDSADFPAETLKVQCPDQENDTIGGLGPPRTGEPRNKIEASSLILPSIVDTCSLIGLLNLRDTVLRFIGVIWTA